MASTWGIKMVINEMAKFWVSLFEMIVYKTTGKLLSDNTAVVSVLKALKPWVLFNPKIPQNNMNN
jgi:hypothetical protein